MTTLEIEDSFYANYGNLVQRAAKLLDEIQPGWAERVDLHSFTMTKTKSAILTFVFGNTARGVRKLGVAESPLEEVLIPLDNVKSDNKLAKIEEFAEHLDDAWRVEVIRARARKKKETRSIN